MLVQKRASPHRPGTPHESAVRLPASRFPEAPAGDLAPDDALGLQGSLGNQGVSDLVSRQASVGGTLPGVSSPSSPAEREADAAADVVASGGRVSVDASPGAPGTIHRWWDDDEQEAEEEEAWSSDEEEAPPVEEEEDECSCDEAAEPEWMTGEPGEAGDTGGVADVSGEEGEGQGGAPEGQLGAAPEVGSEEEMLIDDLLTDWTQADKDPSTVNDAGRCQSQVAVAGALQSGGKSGLDSSLRAAMAASGRRQETLKAKLGELERDPTSDPDRVGHVKTRLARLESGQANMQWVIDTPLEYLTQYELNQASDAMFEAYAPDPAWIQENASAPLQPGEQGGMPAKEVGEMEKDLGLTEGQSQTVSGGDAAETSSKVWTGIQPGQCSRVSVHVGSDQGGTNHVVLFGRKPEPDARRYIYNPSPPGTLPGVPAYYIEEPGEKGSGKFEAYMAKILAMRQGAEGRVAHVAPYQSPSS